ncbi:MAG: dehydratase, partial [Dehalococcoidia bacterium]|nr:dehydratase [Dehalococcoidia bacterium]
GAIRRLGFRYKGFSFPGDVLTCKGRVKGKSAQDGQRLVECDLWVENQDGEQVLAPASAALDLPLRDL